LEQQEDGHSEAGSPQAIPDEQLRYMMDAIPALILRAHGDGSVDFINQRWLDYTGLETSGLLGWGWRSVIHPEDVDRFVREWRIAMAEGRPFENEARVRGADGTYRWFLDRSVALRDGEGNIVKWYGTMIDIDDRKRAESESRRSETKLRQGEMELRQLADAVPQHVFVLEADGRVLYANRRAREYTGLSLEDSRAPDVMSRLLHPDDLPRALAEFENAIARGVPMESELRWHRKDGQYRWFLTRLNPMRDQDGTTVRWYGTHTDIEDRKRAEDALRKSEEQWRHVFENNPTMYFMANAEGRVLAVNPFGAEQLGYTIDELLGQSVLQVFFEPDRPEAQKHLARCLGVPGRSLSWELRNVRKDGSLLWVRETARAVLRGEETFVLIACEDVTDRRHAEERVRAQEVELRQMLDLAPQHVAMLGAGGERLYLNQAGLDYYGLTLEEWRAEVLGPRVHADDREHLLVEWRARLEKRLPGEIETRLRGKNGQFRWFLIRANALQDEQGRITRWYTTATDIEDRRRAEDRLKHENVALREEVDKAFEEIIGTSEAIRGVIQRVSKVAPTDSTVLITGETGTGKELVARAVHKKSPRAGGPFISVNCAAIPTTLMSSELFGHEKGAFTGALQRRLGKFEMAEGGTIFLDEIGELPAETQSALLRVLQERELERVGGSQTIPINVRVIAATNRNLKKAMAEQRFRSDLFYRLNVFPIEVPALRDRGEDISLLVEYFIHRLARMAGKRITSIDQRSLELLRSYSWPGNIRELQNVVERSIILCEGEVLSVDRLSGSALSTPSPAGRRELVRVQADQEREIIEAALAESHGRVSGPSGAAAKLGIPSTTLESKIKALKIDKYRFKSS
jgi:PAS domain S-box-containing protein